MNIELREQLYRWLQRLQIIHEEQYLGELSDESSQKLFNGIAIGNLLKLIFEAGGDEANRNALNSINEGKTPAMKLYNWNIIANSLKRLSYTLTYSDKSKILNEDKSIVIAIIEHLYAKTHQPIKSNIIKDNKTGDQVYTSNYKKIVSNNTIHSPINNNTLQLPTENSRLQLPSNNIAIQPTTTNQMQQLLSLLMKKHFQLSENQINSLFIDNNKLLSHLFVKGIKNSFQPILSLLRDIKSHLQTIFSFCYNQKCNLNFFLNVIKPAIISKSLKVAKYSLELINQTVTKYQKEPNTEQDLKKWFIEQGIRALLMGVRRHSDIMNDILEVCHKAIGDSLFEWLQPNKESILWSKQIQKLEFYRKYLQQSSANILRKLKLSNIFIAWNQYCFQCLNSLEGTQQRYILMVLLQCIWLLGDNTFKCQSQGLQQQYLWFLKQMTTDSSQILSTEATRILFALMGVLASRKNPHAPIIYKILIGCLNTQPRPHRIDFICLNFEHTLSDIPRLPVDPLVKPLLHYMKHNLSIPTIHLAGLLLRRATEQSLILTMQMLTKIVFQDFPYSELALEAIFTNIEGIQRDLKEEILFKHGKLCLSHYYSLCVSLKKKMPQLVQEYYESNEREDIKHEIEKYYQIKNIVQYIRRSMRGQMGQQLKTMIFHTFMRVHEETEQQLQLGQWILPVLRSYYKNDRQLIQQIRNYNKETNQQQEFEQQKQQYQYSEQSFSTKPIYKPTQIAIRDIETIKRKNKQLIQAELFRKKRTQVIKELNDQQRNKLNNQRIIQFGSKKHDVEYQCLYTYGATKLQKDIGLPQIQLLKLNEQQDKIIQSVQSLMKTYHKLWRMLLLKYSSTHLQDTIGMAQIWKLLKENQIQLINKDQSQTIIRLINQNIKQYHNLFSLNYAGFKQYIIQLCQYGYNKKGYRHITLPQKIMMLIHQLRQSFSSKSQSLQQFDHPQQTYFQQTEVIQEFNRRLSLNHNYILPEGYKKIQRIVHTYNYHLHSFPSPYLLVLEILDQIFSSHQQLSFHLIQPQIDNHIKYLAKPVLFQNLNQKIANKRYMLPKRNIQASMYSQIPRTPIKAQFRPFVNFSLGIKLGLAEVKFKDRSIADEVAYWMQDMLNAVEMGKESVQNTAKKHIENSVFKRKKETIENANKERKEKDMMLKMRSQSLRMEVERSRQMMREQQIQKRKQEERKREAAKIKQQQELKVKMQEYENAKELLRKKREEEKQRQLNTIEKHRKQKLEHKKIAAQYFKKKREEIHEKQAETRKMREQSQKKQAEDMKRKRNLEKKLYLSTIKKEQEIIQNIISKKRAYEQVWNSSVIQQQWSRHRKQLRILYTLLLKYEHCNLHTISNNISYKTFNYFALKFNIVPNLIDKITCNRIFKNIVKDYSYDSGLTYQAFQQALFKIVVKAKTMLNSMAHQNKSLGENSQPQEGNILGLRFKRKVLADEYLFDSKDTTAQTVRQFMIFLSLPQDKLTLEDQLRMERSRSNPRKEKGYKITLQQH